MLLLKESAVSHTNLVVNEQFRSFKVSRGHSDIVLLTWVVKFSQAPVYQTKLRNQTHNGLRQKHGMTDMEISVIWDLLRDLISLCTACSFHHWCGYEHHFYSIHWRQKENQHCPILWGSPECDNTHTHPYLSVLVINHDIVGLDVSVHDSHTVAVVQGLRRQDSLILLIIHIHNRNPKKYRKCP